MTKTPVTTEQQTPTSTIDVSHLPIAIASIVFYNKKHFLVEAINQEADEYRLLGHSEFGNNHIRTPWVAHKEVELVSVPTLRSWGMLLHARKDRNGDTDDLEPTIS